MAYKHGVYVSEVPTSILPPVESAAGIPFIVGTAPVNMTDHKNVNKPVLCYSYDEAVAAFGYVPPKEEAASGLKKFDYTISEFINSQFALFGVAPVIIVNVLDPTKHKKAATTKSIEFNAKTGSVTVEESGILLDSIVIKDGESEISATSLVTSFDENGYLVITAKKLDGGSFNVPTGKSLSFTADVLDPSAVTVEEVVGGVSTDGAKSGFELVAECFPRFRLVPGVLIAPGFSHNPTLAAVMAAKAENINEHFSAIAIVDVPTDTVTDYTKVAEWKNTNNITDPKQIVCFPLLALDGVVYHQSTQLAGLIGQVDGNSDGVPYVSPSNKNYQMTSAVLADGKEVWLSPDTAAYLNGQGVVTALNFIGGWKCWGNRTAAYPSNSDVKDGFINIRRMFSWVGNTLVQSFWQRVDAPLNRRQVDTIVDSSNQWLNGLTAKQYLLGGRVDFLDTENPTIDLMDGKAVFHVYLTPPTPNKEIDFKLEFDPQYLETLFA